jgi:hypothetical protein
MSLQVRAHGSNYFSLGHRASRFLISSVSQLNISRRLLENKVGQTWGGKKSNLSAAVFRQSNRVDCDYPLADLRPVPNRSVNSI